jgi:hypothetical protein
MMLDNCTYNKIKLTHEISHMLWFLHKHAVQDAQAAGDVGFLQVIQELERDLQKNLDRLRQEMCVVSQ